MAYTEEVLTNLSIDKDGIIKVNITTETKKDGRFIGEESTTQKFRPGNNDYEAQFTIIKDSIVTQALIDQDIEIKALKAEVKAEKDKNKVN